MTTHQSQDSLIQQFQDIVGVSHVISDIKHKESFVTDWRGRYQGNAFAVLKPQTTAQVSDIVKLCAAHNISIIPQGGNTSLCGGATPLKQSAQLQVIINLSQMNHIIEVDTKSNSITVEAGVILDAVIKTVNLHNRYFPLSIGSGGSCQIGGNIATNAGGIHVIKYGMMKDLVLGLEVVLADGSVVDQLYKLYKNNTNFDIKQLFIGSEGTLGIITKAVLKLYPKPNNYITGLVGLDSISQGIDLANKLRQYFACSSFEIIHIGAQEIYNHNFKNEQFPFSNTYLALFEIEQFGDTSDTHMEDLVAAKLLASKIDQTQILIASNLKERNSLWQMRENIPLAEKMYGVMIKHDISLPINKIDDFLNENQKTLLTFYPKAQFVIFGHLGDGNLHYNVYIPGVDVTQYEEHINQLVYLDVHKYQGSISAEHGIGQLKIDWYQLSNPAAYKLAHQIKQVLDPYNRFNPGKIFK